ncbi:uncharacterized protein METZ01_LOCUS71960 [marine metagenome]|uniref:Uncharacterized protein n=1 Tax=marine metagenome TaxID=408172 RepID=A0A381TSV5_9ZZZZ
MPYMVHNLTKVNNTAGSILQRYKQPR